jgi:hypothetical protein
MLLKMGLTQFITFLVHLSNILNSVAEPHYLDAAPTVKISGSHKGK